MKRSRFRLAAALALLVGSLALAACGGGLMSEGPVDLGNLRRPPENLPLPQAGAADALLGGADVAARDPNEPWGSGVLRPSGGAIDLPLFDGPSSGHWGWITQGRVYDLRNERTLPDRGDVMVPASGGRGWLVLSRAEGGWMQIRYGRSGDRNGGLAWTNLSLADGGRIAFLTWTQVLDDARGVVFRSSGGHNLREGPSTTDAIVEELIGTDYDMRVLDIEGDWMRVEVSTPPACAGSVARDLLLGGSSRKVRTGWIFWRSNDRGPWVESVAGARCAGGA